MIVERTAAIKAISRPSSIAELKCSTQATVMRPRARGTGR